jgi:hypothetical protein
MFGSSGKLELMKGGDCLNYFESTEHLTGGDVFPLGMVVGVFWSFLGRGDSRMSVLVDSVALLGKNSVIAVCFLVNSSSLGMLIWQD